MNRTSAAAMAAAGSPSTSSLPGSVLGASASFASVTKWGSTSYSTLIARSASSASASDVAATAATSSSAHWISVPASWITRTALTPGIAFAAETSSDLMRAWACGQRSTLPQSIPAGLRS